MLNKGTKGKNFIIALSAIFIVSFILMTLNIKSKKGPAFFESVFSWIVSPFQTLLSQTRHSISGVADHYFLLVNLVNTNENLQRELENLTQQNNQLRERLYKNERVLGLLERQDSRSERVTVASIIGRDATQWSKALFIDKGTRHEVHENFAVVTDLGLVGHIIQAAPNSSKVLLINDSRSAVDALFQETRVSGVVAGTGGETCAMRHVPIDAIVNVGDKVVSSGMGGIFPKGLLVGTVSHVVKRKQGLFQEITVTPAADLSRLEEVLVLLP